ncbi:MAG: hypothetical protein COX77_00380 [Candidatus Komeilibacteria bacterium CG_4_10_14_0_2_um_filter_37_10]|uniref:DUF2304 domain-containing protein n=1 Tax=Candidatus Komeilibacteria bacterium CG_4_10_14_0_2_um_filter_37_10 TaxID=1974470 RepID=A0A2M7VGF7_9BACT|nr:MAG: hypothetical protein COX77_00380 [Candidatus Komeilibacteria bacterium CG_4_10_14_0_2_um_filter_37_10]PJA94203.1 MAG: hypothetical protein CO133_00315 [Candidatus Komeilibacteria bacterium CG_4_9_14_3_um_filter_37_5]
MILSLIISLLGIYSIVSFYWKLKNGKINRQYFTWWLFFWLVVIILFWWPNISSGVANYLGIGRGADFVLYISVLLLFYSQFKLYLQLNKLMNNQAVIVQQLAINQAKDHEKSISNHR